VIQATDVACARTSATVPKRHCGENLRPGHVRSRELFVPVFTRLDVRRGRGGCAGLLSAIAARHFEGWTLRRARNCRFSASFDVASYARLARASYPQVRNANTANAIGTAKGIIVPKGITIFWAKEIG